MVLRRLDAPEKGDARGVRGVRWWVGEHPIGGKGEGQGRGAVFGEGHLKCKQILKKTMSVTSKRQET